MGTKRLDALVEEFATNVRLQNECIAEGDAKRGNEHANKYLKAFITLAEFGDEGRDALCVLLNDARPDVRAMAACFLLRHKTEDEKRVLLEVSKHETLTGFGAGECLKRWAEGTWQLDPPPETS